LLDLGEAFQIGIADDGDDEAALRADGDADVVKVVCDEFLAFEAGVDRGDGFECGDRGFYEEGHEAELYAVLLLEGVLGMLAEGHDGGHVALV